LDSLTDKVTEWQQLETAMRKLYEDEMRQLQEVLKFEDTEEHDGREFRVPSTGAVLDLDNAVSHLHHFCATLPAKEYVDMRPDFIFYEAAGLIKAKVVLPSVVNEAIRTAESRNFWKSEKNAAKDAAFEAYLQLFEANLVNENLLPLLRHDSVLDELSSPVEARAAILAVHEQQNPWISIANAWKRTASREIRQFTIQVGELEMYSYIPFKLLPIAPFCIFWDSETEIRVVTSSEVPLKNMEGFMRAPEETFAILEAAFCSRFPVQRKQTVILFSSKNETPLKNQVGRQEVVADNLSPRGGLIRDKTGNSAPFIYKRWIQRKPLIQLVQQPYPNYEHVPEETPHLSLQRITRRLDFLHQIAPPNGPASEKEFSVVLPASQCTVDNLPFRYVQFGMLIPSIMHRLEVYLLAQSLSTTLLQKVGIEDISLIVTAITASSAREDTNYQRLEFYGDMILKLCTTVQLVGKYPLWHEGYLSAQKDRLVANSRLSRAAKETGLDRFIVTKAFTGQKWRPLYVDDLLERGPEGQREISC
jgi:hypothetical protein